MEVTLSHRPRNGGGLGQQPEAHKPAIFLPAASKAKREEIARFEITSWPEGLALAGLQSRYIQDRMNAFDPKCTSALITEELGLLSEEPPHGLNSHHALPTARWR